MELVNSYNYLMEECVDPRTKDWFLVGSPVSIFTILLIYCYLVFVGTPNYMKNRKAYSLKTFLKLYNVFQIIVNAHIVYSTVMAGWLHYRFGCEPLNPSTTGNGYDMAVVVWNTYMVKLIDLSETIVFVLRKKYRQVSLLHVYHHITTPLISWMFVKWFPGGGFVIVIIINSCVHVIMYSYYLLSTGGPFMQRLVAPLKQWITIVQMTQFVVLLICMSKYLNPSCDAPPAISLIMSADIFVNLLLFCDFYKKNYCGKNGIGKCD